MAGRGAPPKDERVNKSEVPVRGDWQRAAGIGWQHGDIPPPPTKMLKPSRDTWDIWMCSWVAAHWTPDDLPGLRVVIRLWDQVERGEYQRANELRLQMDTYGITPKGQQDRRWKPPESDATTTAQEPASAYGHLRVAK